MKHVGKLTAGFLLLGATLALTACNLGSSNGSSTADSGAGTLPVQPLSYTGTNETNTSFDGTNTNQAGGSASSGASGLVNNAAGGGVGGLFNIPTSVVATTGDANRASNANIMALFASLPLSALNHPASVTSQNLVNPNPCSSAVDPTDPDPSISFYQTGQYVVLTFTDTCMAILPSSGEATINGQLVVYVSLDNSGSTFTPNNLTIENNSTSTTYSVPFGTYMMDSHYSLLSILVPCEGSQVCKITIPTSGPTQDGGTGAWSFSGATVSDPTLGNFTVGGNGLLLCTANSAPSAVVGTPGSSPFSTGSLTLTGATGDVVTVTFTGCEDAPSFGYIPVP